MNKKSQLSTLNSHLSKGLTLIEMIVAVGVFAIAITIASSLFVNVVLIQAKTTAQRLVNQEARYVMETITREAKLAQGSSSAPAIGVSGEGKILTLTSGTSSKTFSLSSERIQMDSSFLTSNNVKVTQFELENYIDATPTGAVDYKPSRQPSVTISLTVRSIEDPASPRGAQITLQTTISSRDYDYDN